MSTGLKANSDGSAAIQVGGTDVITLTSGGAATFVTSPTTVQAGTAAAPSITFSGRTNTGIYSPAANTLAFSTNGTEDARFDSVGNFGLGVTPAAWSNGAKPIQAVNASFWGLSGFPTFTSIGANYYYDGNYKYIGTGEATDYYQYLGTHAWRTAVSGTAGNTISFTEVMATNTNGGVKVLNTLGVGNTTPSTSGAGITFPATQSASSDANTLDDYEEGTWTPTDASGAGLTFTDVTATYTKIGRMVFAQFALRYPSTANGSNSLIGGMPFAPASGNSARQGFVSYTDETTLALILPEGGGATTAAPRTNAGAQITNAIMSLNYIWGEFVYFV